MHRLVADHQDHFLILMISPPLLPSMNRFNRFMRRKKKRTGLHSLATPIATIIVATAAIYCHSASCCTLSPPIIKNAMISIRKAKPPLASESPLGFLSVAILLTSSLYYTPIIIKSQVSFGNQKYRLL